ncbi:hypothetical protein B296_00043096 [Ensete ventricosum]|uniref:Uncharacterized protein n=1 Tax=Ensete ventricosum TaxID=4639 RepID=A0A426ZG12_ENSVE|nr:hypothetical protein B296_00043096 [Ensete ventricosum]
MDLVEAWRSIDWEKEGYTTYEDFVALPFFVLFFPTVRFFLDRLVFEVSHSCLLLFPLLPCL